MTPIFGPGGKCTGHLYKRYGGWHAYDADNISLGLFEEKALAVEAIRKASKEPA